MTARIKNKLVIGLLQFLCIFFCFGISADASQITNDGGRVLFISSYSYAWNTVQLQIDGIEDGLGANTVLDFEFMNTKRLDTEESRQLLYDRLEYMFSMLEPYDVVILGDDAALQFALENRDTLFQGIPLVFEGVNDEELAARAMEDPLITGVIEKLSPEKNIDLGLMLFPDAKKVVAVLDNSITGETERKRFYSYEDMYPNLEFTEINASILTTAQVRQAIYAVPPGSILIYISMTEDLSGKQYSNREAIELLSSVARIPVLRMVEGGIGEGLLGGNIVSMYKSGEIAAQTAMEIIGGRSVSEFPMMESPNIYNIDADIMAKYEIDLDVLPPGTEILNAPTTFIERNREALIPGLVLIGIMILIMLWFVFDNQRRRKLMKELEEARRIMESASQH
ncbi:MAG: ABC transporter substrate-binding protein, partial [Blautia sp.]|nr:ABC transporter substrate-binding protein [Blautia sp.]